MPIGVPPYDNYDGSYPQPEPTGQVHEITYGGQVMCVPSHPRVKAICTCAALMLQIQIAPGIRCVDQDHCHVDASFFLCDLQVLGRILLYGSQRHRIRCIDLHEADARPCAWL